MPLLQLNGRPWDSFDGYLFDIDGTLLTCADAVHYFAFCDALFSLSGRPLNLDGVTAHGNTDTGILRDALTLANIDETRWRPRLSEICNSMGSFVTQRQAELRAIPLPGVAAVLQHLRNKGATLGVATGNLRTIGNLKLRRAGILDYFHVGGFSDGHEQRTEVFRAAVALMRSVTSPQASLCFLGDTPADIAAAHANGLPIIALASGVYSQEQLLEARPELCLRSFADLFPVEGGHGRDFQ